MIRRVLFLALTALVALVFFYISRFWNFRWWDRDGLFGIEALRPQGGLLARWLRGTDAAPFELLIWVVALFLSLTLLQKIFDLLTPQPKDDDHD
ncbi:hypothetical protein [Hasllibacter sp. MH4015]|uniref:hypothetical protein n=1 Tax=Hasllibacter sp. MH4015 TaxID=2854029 RepID=UPI001CD3AC67|nr:hypothetical protein [Hasllibacter sp. MH4015]